MGCYIYIDTSYQLRDRSVQHISASCQLASKKGLNYIFDVLRSVNNEWSYQGETRCIPTTSKHSDSLFSTHDTVQDLTNLETIKLNEQGR